MTTAVLALLGALYWRLAPGSRGRGRIKPLLGPLMVVVILCWPFALTHFYQEEMTQRGVIVADQAVARTGPSDSQIETFTLPAGRVVRIEEGSTDGWFKISFAGGRKGYIRKDSIRML